MQKNERSGAAVSRPFSGRPSFSTATVLLLLGLLLLPSCGGEETPPVPAPGGYSILPEATWRTGVLRRDAQDNPLEWMLPSSQRITPLAVAGSRLLEIENLSLPLGIAVHPRGEHLFLTTSGRGTQALLVIDTHGEEVLQRIDGDYFLGLAFRAPLGDEIYVSTGGRNRIDTYAFNHETGTLTPRPDRSMPVPGFAGGLCLSPDGNVLLAVAQTGNTLSAFDPATAALLGRTETGPNPYTVAFHPDGRRAYVSCERSGEVQVFDVSDPSSLRLTTTLPTQKNPEALLVNRDGSRLFVTNADSDSVSVFRLDAGTPTLLETIDLRNAGIEEFGSSPNALAFSPDRSRLFIAQAGLNKVAVLDLANGGRRLGEIPTAWFPVGLALHNPAPGTEAGETLFVANGKGVGAPWEGNMRHVPGRISILPVPPDGDLAGLQRLVQENNSFPSRLFSVKPDGPWTHPIPLERGGPTPIKYVFIGIRENKTYDYLLGPYQPARGQAEGDPAFVMEDYEILLPNLYKLVERFAMCDNYYSNAQASNQGHELLTASTVNTYVEKLVFADGRSLPFELEMILNPATWPKKDYIFQNALNHGVSFRVYGEAVGLGKDLMLLDEEYVHISLVDPPWFWMFTKDEDKVLERIEEWESERFAGPNFPRLIFMLLPNDHTWGDRALFPSYKSMVADNDLATGLFVEWLSRSPYWMESVAFITEDDPQQGEDHIDPHRTMMLVISPWVRRGHVSHVRYNEANLFATVESLLGLPPMTIFDGAAQPMLDLFDFTADAEAFQHEAKQYPWESNPLGTFGSRATAQMNFAEPDEAEGLTEAVLAMEAERREAKKPVNRIREKTVRAWDRIRNTVLPAERTQGDARDGPMDPAGVFATLKERAQNDDRPAFQRLLDADAQIWVERYARRRTSLDTSVVPADPVGELMRQFRELAPRPVSQTLEGDQARVDVIYTTGISAQLRFRREGAGWVFDFSHHVSPTVRIMGDAGLIQETYGTARAIHRSSRSRRTNPLPDDPCGKAPPAVKTLCAAWCLPDGTRTLRVLRGRQAVLHRSAPRDGMCRLFPGPNPGGQDRGGAGVGPSRPPGNLRRPPGIQEHMTVWTRRPSGHPHEETRP